MDRIFGYVESLSDLTKTLICLLLCMLFGLLDYFTGDYSVSLFYIIPIAFASWFVGRRAGFFISIVCGAEITLNDTLPLSGKIILSDARWWNAFVEICFFIFSGYLIYVLKVEMETTRQVSVRLEATNKELEGANKELAAANRELGSANEELEAFDYTVAHDLRQPLNLLSSYWQVIDHLFGDELPEDCKEYVRNGYQATLRMNGLIEALLNFSRMGRVEPRRELVDLSMLAREVASSRKLTEPERNVDFQIADGVTANGEQDLLRMILDNLLGNAWKYTSMREKGVIEFGVRDMHGVPTYFVRDNGSGFDMADANKLFAPFQRLPGAEKYRGFGIGLATVERVIRRHGGKVWAEGEPDKGACIYFTLSAAGEHPT